MEDYQAILQVFDQHQSFALSTHVNPDGDALGSELALYSFLKDLGKQVKIFNTDAAPQNYRFLPFYNAILPVKAFQNDFPEVLVVLDAGVLRRIGAYLSRSLVPTKVTVNIDHHTAAETLWRLQPRRNPRIIDVGDNLQVDPPSRNSNRQGTSTLPLHWDHV